MFNSAVARILPLMPQRLLGLVAKRYIAGTDQSGARATVESLAQEGISATIDLLGEAVTSASEADKRVDAYCDLLTVLPSWRGGDRAGISLKPSQFGLHVDPDGCHQRVRWTMERASEQGIFVRIDMEASASTSENLRLYRALRADRPGGVGCALQAKLFRTRNDAAAMVGNAAHDVRLCKGSYTESPDISWTEFAGVRSNYLQLAEQLLEGGVKTRMATHDPWLIERLQDLGKRLDLQPNTLEFQALLGVPMRKTLKRLVQAGHPVRIYVPFGAAWHSYALRRLRENPAVIGAITKGLLSRER